MKNHTPRWLIICLLLLSAPCFAATPDVTIVNTVNAAMAAAGQTRIMPQALMWLSSFMTLQFVITNYAVLKEQGSDVSTVIAKLAGMMIWFSICFTLLSKGPAFIDSVGNGLLTKFAPNIPSPGSIITTTLGLCTTLLIAIAVTGTSVIGTGNAAIANVFIIMLLTVFSVGMFLAIKVMMLTLELGLIVIMSPLSFAFLGLNALKDQGIAPFKSLISLAYRIIILGIIYSAFGEVTNVAASSLAGVDWKDPTSWGVAINTILAAICAFPIIAYLVYKSDSIAASLASGSTNMGPGDVASAAAAGAAAGAAIMSGGATMAASGGGASRSMSDFMKGLTGGGSSVSNASSSGSGPNPSPSPKRAEYSSSGSAGGVGAKLSDTAPARSNYQSSLSSGGTSSPIGVPDRGGVTGSAPARASDDFAPQNSVSSGGSIDDVGAVGALGGTPGGVPNEPGPVSSDIAAPGQAPMRSSGSPSSMTSKAPSRGTAQESTAAGTPAGAAPVRASSGSGLNAGISGATSPLEDKVDKIMGALGGQQPRRPTLGDRLSAVNQHVEKEKATTHVSVSTRGD